MSMAIEENLNKKQKMTDAEKIAFINLKMFECMVKHSNYWKTIWDRERMMVLARMPDKHKVMMYDRNVNRGYGLVAWTIDFADYSDDSVKENFNEEEYFAAMDW